MTPSTYRCGGVDGFIGPARTQAAWIDRLVAKAKPTRKPIKLLILGPTGIGKSELAEHFCRAVGAGVWDTHKWNGTSFKMENVEDLARTLAYKPVSNYRVIRFEEVDAVPAVAQVRTLTLLDDLQPGNAVVATSNCVLDKLEPRFHRRYQVIDLKAPSQDEIASFLCRMWAIDTATADMIAMGSCGSVGQALMDAETALV